MNPRDSASDISSLSRSDQWHAVTASFLRWTLDAFDFFVLVFLVDTLAAQFQVTPSKIILRVTATLAMRPVGALFAAPTNNIEYALRDRFGYAWALAAFEIVNILVLATVVALGTEQKGKNFVRQTAPEFAGLP